MGNRKEWDRTYYLKHKEQHKAQANAWRLAHSEQVREYQKAYDKAHPYQKKASSKKYAVSVRDQFLELYGGRCACCGETEKVFLTLDHVGGRVGIKDKEDGYYAYKRAIALYPSDAYRILCWNCNAAVRWGKTCPHQENVAENVRG